MSQRGPAKKPRAANASTASQSQTQTQTRGVGGSGPLGQHHHQLHHQPPPPPQQHEQHDGNDQRTFDEWMKIAADNKITAQNSWNLGLINYFHDLTLLREGDSINFQKASCTLDGCVKIYTSRVDSVDADTRILLNGLVVGSNGGADGDEGRTDETKKRTRTKGNTLEKDITNLNVKKLDAEFLIDPLFKKTSADFDEGTASGLLLNHLNMTNEGMIIFDASDDITVSKQMADTAEAATESQQQMVDVSKLHEKFMYDVSRIRDLHVCPSLKSFDFSSGGSLEVPKFDFDAITDTRLPPAMDSYVPPDLGADYDDAGGAAFDDDDVGPFEDGLGGGAGDAEGGVEELVRRYSVGLGAAGMQNAGLGDDDDGDEGGGTRGGFGLAVKRPNREDENPFSYFDSSMVKRWAGPEHWKPKPIIKAKDSAAPKKKREPLKIDFLDTTLTEKQLFAPSTTSITLPKYGDKARQKNVLPNDEHFSAMDFLKLFLKPDNRVVFRKKNGRGVDVGPQDNPVDPAFWSQHQNDDVSFSQEPEDNYHQSGTGVDDIDCGNIQDMEDDDGDDDFGTPDFGLLPSSDPVNGIPASGSPAGTMLEYGDLLVEAPKKIKANYIHFAKTQKKVDIRKLKENLWSNLIDLTGDDEEEALTPEKPETHFKEVVQNLSTRYPQDKIGDISVAFCFICLLHLANEKNLTVVSDMGSNDLTIKMNQ
ncbi:condensin complex subunit 2/barren [Chytriomyces sp. MP71]|nr:condensin complex subunit 2/barren [Chytriomyces sp. MP71]